MKDFRGMKRQRNRNRKPSGNQNNPNRAYESNGPEGTKVRGNAQTIYEKYQQLARDSNSSGDRVLAENHLQHAEHYFRMIRQMQPQRPVSEFVQRDPFSSGFDDYDDELDGDGNESEGDGNNPSGEDQGQGDEQPRFDNRDRNNGDRMNGERDNRNNNGDRYNNRDRNNGERNNGNRNDRPKNFEPRNNGEPRNYEPRNNGEPRSFEPRGDRQNADRQNPDRQNAVPNGAPTSEFDANGERRETRRERYERRRQQRFSEQEQNLNGVVPLAQPQPAAFIASTEPLGVSAGRPPLPLTESAPTTFDVPVVEQPQPQPVVRERAPRREKAAARAPADDASHLPAFLSRPTPLPAAAAPPEAPAAAAPASDEAPAKPKRGRKPKENVSAAEEA